MNWRVKGIVQKALSYTPGGTWVNDRLQLYLGELRDFDRWIRCAVIEDWAVLVSNLAEVDVHPRGRTFFEIGTGWFPTLPLCFSLAGASRCISVDITRHLSEKLTFRALRGLKAHLPVIAEAAKRPLEEIESEYARLSGATDLEQLLERARIQYLSPLDAAATGLPDQAVDVVFSNNVFEHVLTESIAPILSEGLRILSPRGVAIHSVNCGDHYAYFDRAITPINYLSYRDSEWRFWNSRLNYQNRKRPIDFKRSMEDAGYRVVLFKYRDRKELRPACSRMRIAPEFAGYEPEQLCATSVMLIGAKT